MTGRSTQIPIRSSWNALQTSGHVLQSLSKPSFKETKAAEICWDTESFDRNEQEEDDRHTSLGHLVLIVLHVSLDSVAGCLAHVSPVLVAFLAYRYGI